MSHELPPEVKAAATALREQLQRNLNLLTHLETVPPTTTGLHPLFMVDCGFVALHGQVSESQKRARALYKIMGKWIEEQGPEIDAWKGGDEEE